MRAFLDNLNLQLLLFFTNVRGVTLLAGVGLAYLLTTPDSHERWFGFALALAFSVCGFIARFVYIPPSTRKVEIEIRESVKGIHFQKAKSDTIVIYCNADMALKLAATLRQGALGERTTNP